MFDFWKLIKKYQAEVDFDALMADANAIMNKYPQNLFRSYIFGFLEQKNIEAIRNN
jgi:hypothetical protein